MGLYHVNPASGEPGLCRATTGKCPFGAADEHYFNEAAARKAYENSQAKGAPTFSKTPAQKATAPTTRTAFARSVKDFFPEKSKVITPPRIDDRSGYLGGSRYVGGKTGTDYMGQKEAAAAIRKEVAAAKKAGELPEWLMVSARKAPGAWVTSIDVEIGMKVDGKTKAIPEEWLEDAESRRGLTQQAEMIETYVRRLTRQYENSDHNGGVDYHTSSNAPSVQFRRKWSD